MAPLPIGTHCIMEFHQCTSGILNDAAALEETLGAGIRAGKLTLVQTMVHAFAPHGLSGVAVLRESHLAMHTWPEFGFVAADLFTCGEGGDPEAVCAALAEALRPRRYDVRWFAREALVDVGERQGRDG
jgi:S-adenosylmethionine decarboxylase